MKKRYLKVISVILLSLFIFGKLGSILEANYDGNQALNGLYQMDKNTADVIFYGSSHIYAGVNTVKLWDEYGIAGYDLAGTMQTLWNSYYNMKESLKYQSPEVMVVDVYGALIEEEYYTSTNVIKNVSNMRFSINKIENVWASVPHEDFLSYLFSYPLTHDSYKDLQKGNYIEEINQVGGKWYKGFKPSFAVTQYDKLPQIDVNVEKTAPSEKNIEYLKKMVNLAKEKEIQLVFIVVPYEGVQKEDEEIYLWVKEFALENDVPFLDGNSYYKEMSFDSTTDFAEASHLNYSGACKFTTYLGKWLKESYKLEDRRGEEKYVSWQNYSDSWELYQKNQDLVKIKEAEEYIDMIQFSENYILFISFDNNYKENPYVALLEKVVGKNPYDLKGEGTFVIDGENLLYQTPDEPEYLWYLETEAMDIAVVREYGGQMQVVVNSINQNNNYSDVSILVYDKKLDMIADVVSFNRDGVINR
ncbi:MAG: hypothetical protein PUD93_11745 [Lachnospiraceae bacterium]|nr:hypothetical protein [Lachnospiraceae bacterium]